MGVRGPVPFTNLPSASSDPGAAYCPRGMWLASSVPSAAETQDCLFQAYGASTGRKRTQQSVVPCATETRDDTV